ncbi:MAG: hypothetical protein ACKPGI_10455 [Verrucomicrobiota bacterium]
MRPTPKAFLSDMMTRIFALVVAVFAVVGVSGQTLPIYSNTGVNPNPVMVDATEFVNTGVFTIGEDSSGLFGGGILNPVMPYETQNTLYYYNDNVMSAIPGFNLQYIDSTGVRRPSARIVNGPGAVIEGRFANLSANITRQGYPNALFPLYGGMVSLSATNIVNMGTIQGFYAGEIRIAGETVNLRHSKVGSTPIDFSTFRTARYVPDPLSFQATASIVTPTSFAPETDVQDQWWRYGYSALDPSSFATAVPIAKKTNIVVDTGRFYIDRTVRDNVTPESTDSPTTRLVLTTATAFVWTNQPSATNKQIEIVFVSNDDTNVVVDVSWGNGPNPVDYPAKTAYVRFTAIQPDLVRQGADTVATQFVITDTFGSQPLPQLLLNALTKNSQSPTNLFAFRAYPPAFNPPGTIAFQPIGRIKTNSSFSPLLLTHWYDKTLTNGLAMTNQITTNIYATWAGELVRLPSQAVNDITFVQTTELDGTTIYDLLAPTPIEGASITNLAGRVSIDAKELDLTGARIQGQGAVTIRADNLKGSRGAIIDAPVLSYDIGSTNDVLEIRDLAKGSSSRFGGQFAVYSTTFTNSTETQIVEPPTDPNGSPTTNTVPLIAIYHVTVVRNSLDTKRDTIMNDLVLRSKSVDIQDSMYVDGKFYTTAGSLTTRGPLLFGSLTNFTDANVPNLRSWTNTASGILAVESTVNVGGALPGSLTLDVFRNEGFVASTAVSIGARRFELAGELYAEAGAIRISAENFVSQAGILTGGKNAILRASNANLAGLNAQLGGEIGIIVADSLTDGGSAAPSLISVQYGAQIYEKPKVSNLRGTTLEINVPSYSRATSLWPASDLGKTPAGFTNNLALGSLKLEIKNGGVASFYGDDPTNAMYVEKLVLGPRILFTLTNAIPTDDGILLDAGMTLYFSSTSTNTTPAKLDGLVTPGGGKLVYLPLASGLVSVINGDGRTVEVPQGVRYSNVLDSDGDGIPNAADPSPFDVVAVGSTKLFGTPAREIEVQWDAIPGQSYEIQSTKDLANGKWIYVRTIANPTAATERMSVREAIDPGDGFKAYRVVLKF